jgi:Holliday junction resolvase RusA-like endonuclease
MSVRKRIKDDYEAWIVDYVDAGRRRRHKTFPSFSEADRFHTLVKAMPGLPPELLNGHKPIEFTVALASPLKSNRAGIIEALRAAYPELDPTTESIVMQIIAETPPRHVIADVDNFLKPVLDALSGVVWIDDTQVCQLLVRRILSRVNRLQIKIWRAADTGLMALLNAMPR